LINIPLSILLAIFFNLGVKGVVLGSVICMAPGIVLSRVQYFKLINQKAHGLWLK
jgi:hypothetical protein